MLGLMSFRCTMTSSHLPHTMQVGMHPASCTWKEASANRKAGRGTGKEGMEGGGEGKQEGGSEGQPQQMGKGGSEGEEGEEAGREECGRSRVEKGEHAGYEIHPSIYLSINPSIRPFSIYPFIHPSICPSAHHPSIYLYHTNELTVCKPACIARIV